MRSKVFGVVSSLILLCGFAAHAQDDGRKVIHQTEVELDTVPPGSPQAMIIRVPFKFYAPRVPGSFDSKTRVYSHTRCDGLLNVYKVAGRTMLWVATEPGERPDSPICWGYAESVEVMGSPGLDLSDLALTSYQGRPVCLKGNRELVEDGQDRRWEWLSTPVLRFGPCVE